MARKIDIRKIATPTLEYYSSVDGKVPFTAVQKVKFNDYGRFVVGNLSSTFSTLTRTLVNKIQSNEKVEKKVLTKEFALPSRVFNTALKYAEGVISGTTECQKADLEDTEEALLRTLVDCIWCPKHERHGRLKKIQRLIQKKRNLYRQIDRPSIHFGKDAYYDQENPHWKKQYTADRNDRVGCLGSSDETGGNSTFRIVPVCIDGKAQFEVFHSRKSMGRFRLDPKKTAELQAIQAINLMPFQFQTVPAKQGKRIKQPVKRAITTGRIPLTVWLIHNDNGWYIHLSFMKELNIPDYEPTGAVGVDLNCDSIAYNRVNLVDGKPVSLHHVKLEFDPSWSRKVKHAWLHEKVNAIVKEAKESGCVISLEYLDFENCKRWCRVKLGAMLRIMPYRAIRKMFERKCRIQGVILRYVKSNYTSLLGAILLEYPNMSRDEAAALVIGLRSVEEGNTWLEERSKELLAQEKCRLRINRKRQFGCTVRVEGAIIERQMAEMDSESTLPKDRDVVAHTHQNRIGRAISDLSKAMGAFFRKEAWVPVCWERSDPKEEKYKSEGPWHAVVPVSKRSDKIPQCSSLST